MHLQTWPQKLSLVCWQISERREHTVLRITSICQQHTYYVQLQHGAHSNRALHWAWSTASSLEALTSPAQPPSRFCNLQVQARDKTVAPPASKQQNLFPPSQKGLCLLPSAQWQLQPQWCALWNSTYWREVVNLLLCLERHPCRLTLQRLQAGCLPSARMCWGSAEASQMSLTHFPVWSSAPPSPFSSLAPTLSAAASQNP